MLLPEYKGKALLRQAGLNVATGQLVRSVLEAEAVLSGGAMTFPLALKAQVATGGRGKLGGVRRAENRDEALAAVSAIFAIAFEGESPEAILIEPWVAIDRELYLSIIVDASAEGYMVLYSPRGGVDVEAGEGPIRYEIGLPWMFRAHVFRQHLEAVETDGKLMESVAAVAHRLLRIATAQDCTTIEINPLALLADGSLMALDAKVVIDEWAASRNSGISEEIRRTREKEPPLVQASLNMNHMYVPLDGDIGIISGGAGMTMCAMDMVAQFGGRPACFLDCSPGPTSARGYKPAFDMLDADPKVRAILVSIFGGGTQMQRVANAMKDVLAARTNPKPVVFRLNGTNVDQANEIFAQIGIRNHATLESAVEEVVHHAGAAA